AVRAAETDTSGLGAWTAKAAEIGLTSVALPDAVGGGDGTVLDQAVALEAAARGLVPGPLLTTTVVGLCLTDPDLQAGIAKGAVSIGIGVGGSLDLVEETLSGRIPTVFEASSATHLLLAVTGGTQVVVAAEQVSIEPASSVDLSRTVGSVLVADLPLADVVVVSDPDLERQHDLLITLIAAEASGIARWCLDTAVEYAKVREQFGKPIGAFQSIKHLCAEMLETSESVTAVAWDAARAHAESAEQFHYAASVAGVVALDGAVAVAKSCIQVLGGIGFTFEHDAHLYLRRALALRATLRSSTSYAVTLATLAGEGQRRSARVDLATDGNDHAQAVREEIHSLAGRIRALSAHHQHAELADSGLLAPHWPTPWGRAADPLEQLVVDEELARAGIERPDLKIGAWAAPTVIAHGTEQQRERFVGPTLRGELTWCQLFSEPGAGSDLASLRTRAERAEGGWRLTGQKVWTSLAHEADWGICLARTDPDAKPHSGITYFLVDMASAGIEVRPLREMTGELMFNEVFLDDVFVPDECVVGEVNGGWRLARTTLANERVAMAGTRLGDSVERALSLAEESRRSEVGRAVALATVVKLLGTRSALRSLAGQGPGPESSVAKLVGVRSRQDSAELVVDLLGSRVFVDDELARAALHELLLTRCLSIAGGTTQVLRNVTAERVLGLPRS
ncbi:MAG: acyl-CoA dehydrogenase, partial [Marmoricola sp.]